MAKNITHFGIAPRSTGSSMRMAPVRIPQSPFPTAGDGELTLSIIRYRLGNKIPPVLTWGEGEFVDCGATSQRFFKLPRFSVIGPSVLRGWLQPPFKGSVRVGSKPSSPLRIALEMNTPSSFTQLHARSELCHDRRQRWGDAISKPDLPFHVQLGEDANGRV